MKTSGDLPTKIMCLGSGTDGFRWWLDSSRRLTLVSLIKPVCVSPLNSRPPSRSAFSLFVQYFMLRDQLCVAGVSEPMLKAFHCIHSMHPLQPYASLLYLLPIDHYGIRTWQQSAVTKCRFLMSWEWEPAAEKNNKVKACFCREQIILSLDIYWQCRAIVFKGMIYSIFLLLLLLSTERKGGGSGKHKTKLHKENLTGLFQKIAP